VGGNQPLRLGDHMTISQSYAKKQWEVTTLPLWQSLIFVWIICLQYYLLVLH